MILAIVIGACVVLLLIGIVAPRLANRTKSGINRKSARAKGKAKQAPNPVEAVVDRSIDTAQKAADASLDAGEKVHKKIT